MVLLITQNTHVKIPKYPQRQSFFLVFSKAKSVIWLYLEIEKTWIPLWKKAREIIVLKPDLVIDPVQWSGHGSDGLT